MTKSFKKFYVVLLILIVRCECRTQGSSPQQLFQMSAQSPRTFNTPLQLPIDKPRIVVYKKQRKLELFSNQKLLRTYRVALGFNPVPDKQREGDGATPEGDFYIFVKNNKSAYYLSLGISYPNAEDAERGFRDGLINKKQRDDILEAIKRKTAPPQYTQLGGLIYLHGNGSGKDWTWGCVALENADIKELYDAVVVGTPVTIKP
jgi:murein L,D-transpeptidase YafK